MLATSTFLFAWKMFLWITTVEAINSSSTKNQAAKPENWVQFVICTMCSLLAEYIFQKPFIWVTSPNLGFFRKTQQVLSSMKKTTFLHSGREVLQRGTARPCQTSLTMKWWKTKDRLWSVSGERHWDICTLQHWQSPLQVWKGSSFWGKGAFIH